MPRTQEGESHDRMHFSAIRKTSPFRWKDYSSLKKMKLAYSIPGRDLVSDSNCKRQVYGEMKSFLLMERFESLKHEYLGYVANVYFCYFVVAFFYTRSFLLQFCL